MEVTVREARVRVRFRHARAFGDRGDSHPATSSQRVPFLFNALEFVSIQHSNICLHIVYQLHAERKQ